MSTHPFDNGGGEVARMKEGNFVLTRIQAFKHKGGIPAVNVWFRELRVGVLGAERQVRIAQPPDNGAGGQLMLADEVIVGLQLGADPDHGQPYDVKQRGLQLIIRKLEHVRLGSREGPFHSKEPEDNGGGDKPLIDRQNVVIIGLQVGKDDFGEDERQHWFNIWCSEVLGPSR